MIAHDGEAIASLDPQTTPDRLLRMSSASTKKEQPQIGRYRFSLDEYHELVESGFFKREDHIELIEGELIMMPPPSPEHSANATSLRDRIQRLIPDKLLIRESQPVTIPPDSEPEPDLCVVPRRTDYYRTAHPSPKDVLLVIEVAKTSAAFDKTTKAHVYGRAGIVEYWVIEIEKDVVHVFSDPTTHGYRTQRTYQRGDTVRSSTIRKLVLGVSDMLL